MSSTETPPMTDIARSSAARYLRALARVLCQHDNGWTAKTLLEIAEDILPSDPEASKP